MKCPKCGSENRQKAKFCNDCGIKLELICPECKSVCKVSAKFCDHCGTRVSLTGPDLTPLDEKIDKIQRYLPQGLTQKILAQRDRIEGERKNVTVLFCDMAGFTALSDQLDPEEAYSIMDRVMETLIHKVHDYEGTVNKMMGDGLMALFGAPIALEDGPRRAILSALAIHEAMAEFSRGLAAERPEFPPIQMRIGINTGPVVLGTVGNSLRVEFTAVGDTVNLAARMESLAEPGTTYVTEITHQSTAAFFEFEALGEQKIKGKGKPVSIYKVISPGDKTDRFEASLVRGLSAFVGREPELNTLMDRFGAVQEHRGQTVFIHGEAGIGKSRLVHEFRQQTMQSGARWLTGRSTSYGKNITHLPMLDIVKDLMGIRESDPVESILKKIETNVLAISEKLAWIIPFIRFFLALDPGDRQVEEMVPAQRSGRANEALQALISEASQAEPVVLLIEDLHWIDPQSESVIRYLLERMAASKVMILLTYRPGYTPSFGSQAYFTDIPLQRLRIGQSEDLVKSFLGSENIPRPFQEMVIKKAEGNPLFIEELCRSLIEDGTLQQSGNGYELKKPLDKILIPGTIEDVIMARIDRLPEESKEALQVASVIGREFTVRMLERVSGLSQSLKQTLGQLRVIELIYEKTLYPELEYMFGHALTHDVAYQSLIRQRQKELHRKVGEVMETLYADLLPEFYETLAWHFQRAEDWAKRAYYLVMSAKKLKSRYAYQRALQQCESAVDLMENHGASTLEKIEAYELIGDLKSYLLDISGANQAYEQALTLCSAPKTKHRLENKMHRRGEAYRNGAKIVYYQHGVGNLTIVCIFPFVYGLLLQPMIEALCQDFRIITIDQRGLGESDPIPDDFTWTDVIEDARAVIESSCNKPVVVIGNSRTGPVALDMAITHPHLVERLVLIASVLPASVFSDIPALRAKEDWGRWEGEEKARGLRKFCEDMYSEPGTQEIIELVFNRLMNLPSGVVRTQREAPIKEQMHLLPTMTKPVLLLHGDADLILPLTFPNILLEVLPNARLHILKNRGHSLPATATSEIGNLIRDFLRTDEDFLTPTLSREVEFSYDGPPAFTVTYPDGSKEEKPERPEAVWQISTPAGLPVQAVVAPIPEGIELKDVAENAYKPLLEEILRTKSKLNSNEEITLSDGNTAYYSEMHWNTPIGIPMTTMVVSVYKEGKWVYIVAHAWINFHVSMKIIKSLRFK
jgi:class 3 adenylate cyclase/pimeloyl-ACP methyl ester carboxylesterase